MSLSGAQLGIGLVPHGSPSGDSIQFQAMPQFGRAMLAEWLLDPGFTYLNHGTVGAPPARVLRAQQALRDEIERAPHLRGAFVEGANELCC